MLHLWQTLLVVSAPASAGGLHQEPGQEDEGPDAGYHPGQPTLRYRRLKTSISEIFHHYFYTAFITIMSICVSSKSTLTRSQIQSSTRESCIK